MSFLYDREGNRKYLTRDERRAFMEAAKLAEPEVRAFCLVLAYAGARISEVLSLTPGRFDFSARMVVIERSYGGSHATCAKQLLFGKSRLKARRANSGIDVNNASRNGTKISRM